MKVLKLSLYIVLAIVLILVILALVAPVNYHIEKETKIEGDHQLVYEEVVHFDNFHHWSPWTERDPDMMVTYEGTPGEIGAKYSWEGNEEAGQGSQEIKEISGDTIFMDLVFLEPWESTAEVYYIIEDHGNETRVVWGMHSSMPRPLNVMGWFMGIENAIGKDYEMGLENLQERVAEQAKIQKERTTQTEFSDHVPEKLD